MMSLQSDDFELFGLQHQFSQERTQLDARWKDLQREAHPDKFSAQGSAAQRVAMQWSVRINEAYQRLKDPLKRAAYLCEINGHPVNAENNTAMQADFLMQQMQWRETLDESTGSADLSELQSAVHQSRQAYLESLAHLIDVDHNFSEAVAQVRALMFIERFVRDVEQKFDQIET